MTTTADAKQRQAFGGVHPSAKRPVLHGADKAGKEIVGVAPAAGAFPGFVWNGGPVVKCPQVYASFWGSLWLNDPAHLERAGRMSQFLKDLVGSPFMNVLTQYGLFGSGFFIQASFVRNIASSLSNGDIENTIQSCINAGALPEPSNPSDQVLVIFLDENTGVDDPGLQIVMCEPTSDTAFGYHDFFTTAAGNPFYYAVIPGLSDACLTESCPSDAGCSLHLTQPQEARLTQVASHEFAEMVTDPELNAWFDPVNGECGDICNGESAALTVGSNTWNVQPQYSKFDDMNTDGTVFCLSQAPSPEPRLNPGPAGLSAVAVQRAMREGPVDRLLPLAPMIFDAQRKEATSDRRQVREYVGRLFSPLRHDQVISNFPTYLRSIAAILEDQD